jgi:EAL domain-containing protein (putative c-di-GMP-specific phosphodiesterase class I)
MTDFERVRSSLEKIRKLGAHIALDDFGVGYSNFQHLDELVVDKLKIDRRFVAHIGSKANSGRIVKTMIEMCTNLGLICIVEGVETANELSAVMDAGGTIVQGYHFSRPIGVDHVKPFLERGANIGDDSLRQSA